MAGVSWAVGNPASLRHGWPPNTPLLALESVVRSGALQGLADADVADDIVGLAMQRLEGGPGFFLGAGLQLGEFEAALTVELVFDDVLGGLGHGATCCREGRA